MSYSPATRSTLLSLMVLGSIACGAEPPPPSNMIAAQPICPPAATAPAAAAPASTGTQNTSVSMNEPPSSPLPPPPTEGVATLKNGLKMHYIRQGKGPTLVLLQPGTGSAEFSWSQALPVFAQQYDVIAPDQVAHGKTPDDPKHPMSYHPMAEDTVELLGQLGVSSAALVGWSDGGNLALDIAMHHPSLPTKIVVTGANYSVAGIDPAAMKWLKGANVSDWPHEAVVSYEKLSPDGAKHFPVVFDRIKKMWMSEPKWTTKDLAKIKTPVLVIAGDHDMVTSTHTMAMAAAIPGSEAAILPHATHEVVIEDAPRWNATVLAFLNAPPPKVAEDRK